MKKRMESQPLFFFPIFGKNGERKPKISYFFCS